MSPRPQFDPLVHEPTRLKICTILTPMPEMDYGRLQEVLALTAPTLSKHLRALAEADYVRLTKQTKDGHVHTRVALTPAGREALCGHVSEIQRMARVVRGSERRFPHITT
ncbi:transcriptional regulator [Demetria terragena]|uniref:transcriptional regulator n=1 Tax=Demetria terragena TaxID=63959 RepID=UPI0003A50A46|nr:transcriptional regulator [Demetria terragena]